MKYRKETIKLNNVLKEYANAIINDSQHKDKWMKESLDIFVDRFVRDEIQYGRIQAELNLYESLEREYNI